MYLVNGNKKFGTLVFFQVMTLVSQTVYLKYTTTFPVERQDVRYIRERQPATTPRIINTSFALPVSYYWLRCHD